MILVILVMLNLKKARREKETVDLELGWLSNRPFMGLVSGVLSGTHAFAILFGMAEINPTRPIMVSTVKKICH